MVNPLLYYFIIFFEIFFLAFVILYIGSLVYSSLKGSPYVPTKNKEVSQILDAAKLKKNSWFLDLGCGDGRVVQEAVKNYRVKGVGVDINPIVLFFAKIKSTIKKLDKIEYIKKDVFETDLAKYDVIYVFLMPDLFSKLSAKIKKEAKKGALIISHGFKIDELKKNLFFTLKHTPFPTYYYQLN